LESQKAVNWGENRSPCPLRSPLGSHTHYPGGHNRSGTLISADRAKQMFGPPVITTRHFATQPAFPAGTPEHGQYQGGQSSHSPYAVGQGQHAFAPGQAVPVSYASSQQIRGEGARGAERGGVVAVLRVPGGQAAETVTALGGRGGCYGLCWARPNSVLCSQSTLRPMHPQALHPNQGLLPAPQIPVQMQTAAKPGFQTSPQPAPRHPFIQHGQRFYHK
uniref:Uncharacterized protein n=2 Tax=Sphenodon punctatus TaxID=8508 RepID=A0A8D0HTE5_SPHPU